MNLCALCQKSPDLQSSHILPKFVWRYMIKSSMTGYMRMGRTPNKRVQDGLREKLLCLDCERIFSSSESTFAESVFYPLHQSNTKPALFPYGPWLLKFAVSVSWRNLFIHLNPKFSKFSTTTTGPQLSVAREALETWRKFLAGETKNIGAFQQHMFFSGILDSVKWDPQTSVPPNINRYLARAIDMTIAAGERDILVYSKMGRVINVGFISIGHPEAWEGTRVGIGTGFIGRKSIVLPSSFGEFIFARARGVREIVQKISERQSKIGDRTISENADRAANSPSFTALERDVEMFGDGAFVKSGSH